SAERGSVVKSRAADPQRGQLMLEDGRRQRSSASPRVCTALQARAKALRSGSLGALVSSARDAFEPHSWNGGARLQRDSWRFAAVLMAWSHMTDFKPRKLVALRGFEPRSDG